MNISAKKLGSLGGKATAKKYTKEQRQEWGKKGGRPKKEVECSLDPSCKCEDCQNYQGNLPIDRL